MNRSLRNCGHIVIGALWMGIAGSAWATDGNSDVEEARLGLQERRMVKHLEDNEIPFHQRTFAEMTGGGSLEIEADWSQWAGDHPGLLNLNGYVLQQFTDALRLLTADDLGKEALREQLHTIKVVRTEDSSEASINLTEGVLTLTVNPADGWDGVVDSTTIREYLTNRL